MIVNHTPAELEIRCDRTRAKYVSAYFILPGIIAMILWVISSASLLFLVGGVVFVASGIFLYRCANRLRSVFKRDGDVTIETMLTVSKKMTTQTIALSNIIGVHYTTSYRTAHDAQYQDASTVFIVLRDGVKIIVDEQGAFPEKRFIQISKHSAAVNPLETEARTLAEFLSVPLTITDLSNLRPFVGKSQLYK